MTTHEGFLTHYQHIAAAEPNKPGLAYLFATLDRKPSLDECLALHVKYFESHFKPSVPHGEVLFVDLRPAFRKPLDDVTPKFHVIDEIPKHATPPES